MLLVLPLCSYCISGVQELENDDKFEIEHDANENKHSLIISQITAREGGCYMCLAENSEGSDSTMGFITVRGERQITSFAAYQAVLAI